MGLLSSNQISVFISWDNKNLDTGKVPEDHSGKRGEGEPQFLYKMFLLIYGTGQKLQNT